jgi:ABC-type dipeptide/oligopeptide/nickel transport system permease subunit
MSELSHVRPRRLRASPSLIAGLVLSLVFIAAALVSFLWTPYDVTKIVITAKLKAPSAEHWFGTDHFGRDVFSMIRVGARNSIAVALVAVGIGGRPAPAGRRSPYVAVERLADGGPVSLVEPNTTPNGCAVR